MFEKGQQSESSVMELLIANAQFFYGIQDLSSSALPRDRLPYQGPACGPIGVGQWSPVANTPTKVPSAY